MKLTEQKKQEWEDVLKESELMGAEDTIMEYTQGDCWDFFIVQTRGRFFFTKEKFIFVGGLGGTTFFSINYGDIKKLKLSFVGPLIPTGLVVSAFDAESNKVRKYTCSVMKRKVWRAYLAERANITI